MKRRKGPIVAIDGPAGAGKSTVAAEVARRLGFTRLETGALYRAVAWQALRRGVPLDDEAALEAIAQRLPVRFEPCGDGSNRVWLGEQDVTLRLRDPAVGEAASRVAALPSVRAALLGLQRELGAEGRVVLDGRDIGTVVFPDAEVKVFLTASPEERARRRMEELRARGIEADPAEVLEGIVRRDRQDSGRDVAPLRAAEDAITLDSTKLSVEEVVERIVPLVERAARRMDPGPTPS